LRRPPSIKRATLSGTITPPTPGSYLLEFYNWRNASPSHAVLNYIDDIKLEPLNPDLSVGTDNIRIATGGSVTMSLDAGSAHAGKDYFLLASFGNLPGINVDGFHLLLNMDPLLNYSANNPNSAVFQNSMGVLDGSGQATAVFNMPGPVDPVYLGTTFTFSYVLLTGPGMQPVIFVSIPVLVNFIP